MGRVAIDSVFLVILISSTVAVVLGKEIFISMNSKYKSDDRLQQICGNISNPCLTFHHALAIFENGDTLVIDGGNDKMKPYVYPIQKQFHFHGSLTIRKSPSSSARPILSDKISKSFTPIVFHCYGPNLTINGVNFQRSNRFWFKIRKLKNLGIFNSIFLTKSISADGIDGGVDIQNSKLSFCLNSIAHFQFCTSGVILGLKSTSEVAFSQFYFHLSNVHLRHGRTEILLPNYKILYMENCTFINNPVEITGNNINIKNSQFQKLYRNRTRPALSITASVIHVINCTFTKNSAILGLTSALRIKAVKSLTLSNIQIEPSNFNGAMLRVEVSELRRYSFKNINLRCHPGMYMFTARSSITFVVSCQRCPREYYINAPVHWKLNTKGKAWRKEDVALQHKIINCLKCPFGGVCEGSVKSKGAYWGYHTNTEADGCSNVCHNKTVVQQKIEFIQCPSRYCCSNKDSCTSYDTCMQNRRGRLCSECQQGYSTSVTSGYQCVNNSNCYNSIVPFVVYFVIVAMFLALILYLKDIIVCAKNFVMSKSIIQTNNRHRETSDIENELPLLERLLHESFERGDNRQPEPFQLLLVSTDIESAEYNTTSSVISGSVKILFFFYQAAVILRIDSVDKISIALPKVVDFLVSLFNVRLDLNYSSFSLCIMSNMNIVLSEVFKLGYLIIVFALLFVLFWMYKCFYCYFNKCAQHYRHDDEQYFIQIDQNVPNYCKPPFDVRIKGAYVQFLLIGFSTISTFCLSSMNCVVINNERYLYIQATIKCYQPWQYFIISFVALWIIPFCVAIHLSSNMLKNCLLSPAEFLVTLTFPITILWFLIRARIVANRQKEHLSSLNINSPSKRKASMIYKGKMLGSQDAMLAKHLLLVIDEPFKKQQLIQWESVLILRRLLLVTVKIFIISPMQKVFPLTLMLIVYMIHHNAMKPFKDDVLNKVEFISLNLLISLGFANMYWAVTKEYDFTGSSSYQTFGKFLMIYEVIVLLLPLMLSICFGFYMILRRLLRRFRLAKQS